MNYVLTNFWHRLNCLFILLLLLAQNIKADFADDINQIKEQYNLMGGVALIHNSNQPAISVPFGLADYHRQINVTDSTLFRIASISKLVTALSYMTLVDQGYAALDNDISTVLGYQVRNPYYPTVAITPRMLMSHKSGFVDGSTYSVFLNATASQIPMPALSELLLPGGSYYSSSQFNSIMPGSYFNYSNLNYIVLATLIEKISGERFDGYCQNHILLPLGIRGSFNVNHIADLNNLAVLYRKINGTWTAQTDDCQGVQPVFANLTGYQIGANGARFSPQGGLRISASDLSRIMTLLVNGGIYNGIRIISSDKIELMLTDEWSYNGSNGNNYYNLFHSWGLGVHRIKNVINGDVVLSGSQAMFGHPGEAYGLVSDAYVDLMRKIGVIFITNGCGIGYQTGNNSAFYSVENSVFTAMDPYADSLAAIPQQIGAGHQPDATELKQNYPNPFNPQTSISYSLKTTAAVSIDIFNCAGQLAKSLVHTVQQPGNYSVVWNAADFSSGIYYYRMKAGDYQLIKQAVLIR